MPRTADQAAAQASVNLRTIPNARAVLSTSGSEGTQDLADVDDALGGASWDLRGCYVYVQALTADCTLGRGETITAGAGYVVTAGEAPQEFLIGATGSAVLHHIATGAGSLVLLWDTDQARPAA